MGACPDSEVLLMLRARSILGPTPNLTAWRASIPSHCVGFNASEFAIAGPTISAAGGAAADGADDIVHDLGRHIYAYATPVILLVGLFGNVLSVKVFRSRMMRRLASSSYLVALSVCDVCVLLSFVLFDWLNKGLPTWPGGRRVYLNNVNGMCHAFLYCSYVSRFVSVWLLVLFTIERHVAVCWPTHRKRFCTKAFARRMIAAVVVVGAVLCGYKPVLSGVYMMPGLPEPVCTRDPAHGHLTFALDAVYGLFITAVPFIVVSILNVPILYKFLSCSRDQQNLALRENRIRLEFTLILLAVSSCFVGLSVPYFVLWCQHFRQSLDAQPDQFDASTSEQLYLTRTVFYLNYCVNFFLYCLAGAYYRREIRSIFWYYFSGAAASQARRVSGSPPGPEARPLRVQQTQQTRCVV